MALPALRWRLRAYSITEGKRPGARPWRSSSAVSYPGLLSRGSWLTAQTCRQRPAGRRGDPSVMQFQAGATSDVQNAQREAAIGIALRHSGQSRVVDSTSGPVRRRSMR